MRGLWLHARERRCSWRLRASTSSMRDERCCVQRGTRTPICSVSSTDRARILAGCLICCSICAGHTRSQTWRSTSLFFASPPSVESALAAVLSLCHAVSCLAVCVLLCRLPSVLRHRHLTCTASIDTTIPAILKYTTIPANNGAEGAVSVRERAVNEAALCVSLMCLMVCLCEVVFRGAAPLRPWSFCHCSRSLFLYTRTAAFRGLLRGGLMPRPP